MHGDVDPSTVQTAHAQVPLSQLHTEQTNQPDNQQPEGFAQDPATGRIIRGGPQDTNKNGTAGRPTLYRPELCEDLIAYFNVEPNETKVIVQRFGKDNVTETPKEFAADLPTLEGWCKKIGIHPGTVSEWVKMFPDFAEAVTRAKAMQKHILMVNGLKGLYDARFAIFIATNVTDLKSKTITEETGERKVIVEHRDFVNERTVIDGQIVDNPNTVPVRA